MRDLFSCGRFMTGHSTAANDRPVKNQPHTFQRGAAAWVLLAVGILGSGCGKREAGAPPVHLDPKVSVIHAETRDLIRTIGQPGFVAAYEQTSLFPKVPGYIQAWNVDIGDPIERNAVLATLLVPELDAEYSEKKALAELDRVQIRVADKTVEVAAAQVTEARASIGRYDAEVKRWESEVKRLTDLVAQKVVDAQVLDESKKQLQSNQSARAAAQATVLAREAEESKAKVDREAAQARAKVSDAAEKRLAALVSYTKITAPYKGIVVERNADTGDFVQSAGGDQSAGRRSADQSAQRGTPIYVVARTDKVRVYVDVPEMDASYVKKGTKAHIRVQALDHTTIAANVTRTSWSLNVQSRTLRAEIDLTNPLDPAKPDQMLLPGMYAYGMVEIAHKGVKALPVEAVTELGNRHYCYFLVDGKAVQTEVQTGLRDSKWVEVVRKHSGGTWSQFTGKEDVILGDLTELSDGAPVRLGTDGTSK